MTRSTLPLLLPLLAAGLVAAALVAPRAAAAQPRPAHDALEAPLRGFTAGDVRRLEPLLRQGTVGLVELPHGALLPAVHLAAVVQAPAATVAHVIGHPEAYPRFMPAVSEVSLTDREGDTTGFAWRWQTAIFALRGDAMLTMYAPPPGQEARGYRIAVERTGGDLGTGREIWRILPRGDDACVITLSTRMDLRDANYLARQVAAAARSLNRSVNLAMAFAMLLRVQAEAESRAGHERPAQAGALARPTFDLRVLEPLLRRGDMLLIESNGPELLQSTVMSRLEHPEARVRAIMVDPVAFSQALIPGSHATIRERRDDGVAFDWGVDLPIIGTSGAMTLTERADRVIELDATGGAMNGGQWRFATERLPSGATGVVGWARFDVGTANFLLRAIVDADAGFRPGLSAATEIMMARALRIRVGG